MALNIYNWLNIDAWNDTLAPINFFPGSFLCGHRRWERTSWHRLTINTIVIVWTHSKDDRNEFDLLQVLLDLLGSGLGVTVRVDVPREARRVVVLASQ